MSSLKQTLLLGLSLLISGGFLWWAWQGTDWAEVWNILMHLKQEWNVLSLGALILSFYLRANRWGTLLNSSAASNSLGLRQAAVFIGFGSNCIFPFNAGEIIRANIINRFAQLPLGVVLGSIVSERILDAITAFSLLSFAAFTRGQQAEQLTFPLLGLGIILGCLITGLYSVARYRTHILNALERWSVPCLPTHWKRKILNGMNGLFQSLTVFRSPRRLAIATAQSYVIWGLGGIAFWLLLQAFDLDQPGFIGSLFILCFQAIAAIIPASPGHLGTFEAAMRFALSVFDIPQGSAIAYTVMMRVMMYGSLITFGLIYALKLGLKRIANLNTSNQYSKRS